MCLIRKEVCLIIKGADHCKSTEAAKLSESVRTEPVLHHQTFVSFGIILLYFTLQETWLEFLWCRERLLFEFSASPAPILGTTEIQHLRISWRNPCIWRLDFCQIIKSCSCFWMDHKSKQIFSLIDRFDRFMTSEGSYTLILPFTSKTGQYVAQNRQKLF